MTAHLFCPTRPSAWTWFRSILCQRACSSPKGAHDRLRCGLLHRCFLCGASNSMCVRVCVFVCLHQIEIFRMTWSGNFVTSDCDWPLDLAARLLRTLAAILTHLTKRWRPRSLHHTDLFTCVPDWENVWAIWTFGNHFGQHFDRCFKNLQNVPVDKLSGQSDWSWGGESAPTNGHHRTTQACARRDYKKWTCLRLEQLVGTADSSVSLLLTVTKWKTSRHKSLFNLFRTCSAFLPERILEGEELSLRTG